jgi:hypothetical protein
MIEDSGLSKVDNPQLTGGWKDKGEGRKGGMTGSTMWLNITLSKHVYKTRLDKLVV